MDNIKVAVRVRPLIEKEKGQNNNWIVKDNTVAALESNGKPGTPYVFDRVFDDTYTTSDIYTEFCKQITDSAVEGFHGTVFAYGQSSSGKTYTMSGSALNPGIVPLAISEIFSNIESIMEREFLVRISYMEIYNEKVSDLLDPEEKTIRIQEDVDRNVMVSGLSEHLVKSTEGVLGLIAKGDARRHMAETKQNERSSRSHCIVRIIIESRLLNDEGAVMVSHLNFVDLAGSERASDNSGARFREGCQINKSLLTLSQVIRKLSEGESSSNAHISFRDSKLTRILQNALGGNSKTAIIATITPASVEESHSTLGFACRAKTVSTHAHVNETLSDAAMLRKSQQEIQKLKRKIEEMENKDLSAEKVDLEQKLAEKEDMISNLNKFILCGSQESTVQTQSKKKRRETWCPGALKRMRANSAIIPFEISPLLEEIEDDSVLERISDISPPQLKPGKRSLGEFQLPNQPNKRPRVMFQDQPTEMRRSFEDKCWQLEGEDPRMVFDAESPENVDRRLITLQEEHENLLKDHAKLKAELREMRDFHECEVGSLQETVEEKQMKIHSMEQDLSKKTDIASKAQKDQKAMEERMNQACDEAFHFQHKLEIVTAKLSECQRELTSLRDGGGNDGQIEELKKEVERLTADLEKSQTSTSSPSDSEIVTALKESVTAMKETMDGLQADLEKYKKKADLFEETVKEVQEENLNLQEEKKKLLETISEYETKLEESNAVEKGSSEKVTQLVTEIESHKEMVEKLTLDLEMMRGKAEKVETEKMEEKEETDTPDQEGQIEELKNTYEREIEELKKEAERLSSELNERQSVPDVAVNTEDVTALKQEIEQLQENMQEYKVKADLYEETMREVQEENMILQEEKRRMQHSISHLEDKLAESKTETRGPSGTIAQLEEEIESYKEMVEKLTFDLEEIRERMEEGGTETKMEGEKEEYEEQIVALNQELEKLKEEREKEGRTDRNELDTMKNEYEKKLTESKEQLDVLTKHLNEYKELKSDNGSSVKPDFEQEVKKYLEEIDSLKEQLKQQKTESDVEPGPVDEKESSKSPEDDQAEIEFREEELQALKEALEKETAAKVALETELSSMTEKFKTVKGQLDERNRLIERLWDEKEELNLTVGNESPADRSKICSPIGTDSAVSQYEEKLEQVKADSAQQISQLQQEINCLTKKLAMYEDETLSIQTTDLRDMTDMKLEMECRINSMKEEFERQKDEMMKNSQCEIKKLENENTELQTKLANMMEKMEELKDPGELMVQFQDIVSQMKTEHSEELIRIREEYEALLSSNSGQGHNIEDGNDQGHTDEARIPVKEDGDTRAELEENLSSLRQEKEELEAKYMEKCKEVESLKQEVARLLKILEDDSAVQSDETMMMGMLESLKQEKRDLEREVRAEQEKSDNLTEKIESLQQDLEDARVGNNVLKEECDRLKEEVEKISVDKEINFSQLREENVKLISDMQDKEKLISDLQKDNETISSELNETRCRIDHLISSSEEEKKEVENKLSVLRDKNKELMQEIVDLKCGKETEGDCRLQTELQVTRLQEENEKLQSDIGDLKAKMKYLETVEREEVKELCWLREENDTLKTEVSESRTNSDLLQQKLQESVEELSRIQDTKEQLVSEVEELRTKLKLMEQSVVESKEMYENKLGEMTEVKEKLRDDISELEERLNSEKESYETSRQFLEKQISELEAENENLVSKITAMETATDSREQDIQKSQQELEDKVLNLQSENEKLLSEICDMRVSAQSSDKTRMEEYVSLRQKLEEAEREMEELRREYECQREGNQELESKCGNLKSRLTQVEEELMSRSKEFENLYTSSENLKNYKEKAEEQIAHLNKELRDAVSNQRCQKEELVSKYEAEKELLQKEIAERNLASREEIDSLKLKCTELEEKLRDLELSKSTLQNSRLDSTTEGNKDVEDSLQKQIEEAKLTVKREEHIKRIRIKEEFLKLKSKYDALMDAYNYSESSLKALQEGREDQEVYQQLRQSEKKVDELIQELEMMDREEKVLKNSNKEKDRKIEELQKELKNHTQGKLCEAKEEAERELKQSKMKIIVLEDQLRTANKRVEKNKDDVKKTETFYKEEISRLKNEVRRLQDFDTTYVQTPSAPRQQTMETSSVTGFSGGGGAVDQFSNLILEGTNKKLTNEIKSLNNKIKEYEKKMALLEDDAIKKSSEIEKLKQHNEKLKQNTPQIQKIPLADNNSSTVMDKSIPHEVKEQQLRQTDLSGRKKPHQKLSDFELKKEDEDMAGCKQQ